MKKIRNIIITIVLIMLDILVSWILYYICDMYLSDILGPDIVVYENWFGDIENPVKYHFGIGTFEIIICIIQMLFFTKLEILRLRRSEYRPLYTYLSVAIHVANAVIWLIFYINWNSWVSLPRDICNLLPQYIIQKWICR